MNTFVVKERNPKSISFIWMMVEFSFKVTVYFINFNSVNSKVNFCFSTYFSYINSAPCKTFFFISGIIT